MKYFLILLTISGICFSHLFAENPRFKNQTEKFLMAVQKKDFKNIFDTIFFYQMELKQIKSNNPKLLWQKLITEYYESKRKAFFEKEEKTLADAWMRFGGEFFGTPTDPIENIHTLTYFLTPMNKWKVIETKNEKYFDQWTGRQYDVFVVYVSLSYKTVEVSPLIASKVLKETILGFVLDGKTGLYLRSSRIVKGDVYWEFPMRTHNLRYEYLERILRLSFELDGGKIGLEAGKPPYKYDFFINDKTPQDFLKQYTFVQLMHNQTPPKMSNYLYKILYGYNESEKKGKNIMTDEKLEWGDRNPDCGFCLDLEVPLLNQFTWPPDISFPVQVKVVVRDSSTPPKQSIITTTISEGKQEFPKPWRSWGDIYWIEINGKMYLPPGYFIYNLGGVWQGSYFEKNRFSGKYENEVSFVAKIQQDGWKIKGVITEQDPKSGNILEAVIDGYFWENDLWFSKNYRSQKAYPVKYEGFITAEGNTIDGKWNNSAFATGKWSMRKGGYK